MESIKTIDQNSLLFLQKPDPDEKELKSLQLEINRIMSRYTRSGQNADFEAEVVRLIEMAEQAGPRAVRVIVFEILDCNQLSVSKDVFIKCVEALEKNHFLIYLNEMSKGFFLQGDDKVLASALVKHGCANGIIYLVERYEEFSEGRQRMCMYLAEAIEYLIRLEDDEDWDKMEMDGDISDNRGGILRALNCPDFFRLPPERLVPILAGIERHLGLDSCWTVLSESDMTIDFYSLAEFYLRSDNPEHRAIAERFFIIAVDAFVEKFDDASDWGEKHKESEARNKVLSKYLPQDNRKRYILSHECLSNVMKEKAKEVLLLFGGYTVQQKLLPAANRNRSLDPRIAMDRKVGKLILAAR